MGVVYSSSIGLFTNSATCRLPYRNGLENIDIRIRSFRQRCRTVTGQWSVSCLITDVLAHRVVSKEVRRRGPKPAANFGDIKKVAAELLEEMTDLQRRLADVGVRFAARLHKMSVRRRPSALNLLHYLVLRNRERVARWVRSDDGRRASTVGRDRTRWSMPSPMPTAKLVARWRKRIVAARLRRSILGGRPSRLTGSTSNCSRGWDLGPRGEDRAPPRARSRARASQRPRVAAGAAPSGGGLCGGCHSLRTSDESRQRPRARRPQGRGAAGRAPLRGASANDARDGRGSRISRATVSEAPSRLRQ